MIHTRTYLANTHIHAAAMFAVQARDVEALEENARPKDWFTRHRGLVVASITSSVAFLEGTANSIFADAADRHLDNLSGVAGDVVDRLARLWRMGIPRTARYSVIEKVNVALALAGKEPIGIGEPPGQDAHFLIKLRNALVHYEPEWVAADSTVGPGDHHQMERLLRGRFAENPLTAGGNPFFPDKVLGHGCAAWAVNSALAFAERFFAELGASPAHAKVWGEIRGVL